MMSRKIKILLVLFCLLHQHAALATKWQRLASGIEYHDFVTSPLTPWAHIHVFRVDPKKVQLHLSSAKDLDRKSAPIEMLAEHQHALIAINGGFFDNDFRPLGLRLQDARESHPLKPISWWGVFFIKHHEAHIVSMREYAHDKQVTFGVQSGPRLLINDTIPHLHRGIAERTAIGVTKKGQLILLVTEKMLITTTELAMFMRQAPLYCLNALNLDGGSSSQLYAHIGTFHLLVPGFSNLSDAITITV